MIETAKKVHFYLSDGTLVELDMTKKLVDTIKSEFDLKTDQDVTDSVVKKFLIGAIKNAVEKTGMGDVEISA